MNKKERKEIEDLIKNSINSCVLANELEFAIDYADKGYQVLEGKEEDIKRDYMQEEVWDILWEEFQEILGEDFDDHDHDMDKIEKIVFENFDIGKVIIEFKGMIK